MTEPQALALLFITAGIALLMAMPLVRSFRRELEARQAGEDARAFVEAEARRPR